MNKKTIWITGGSTGIGKAVAIKFASKGWNVAISARRENLLKDAVLEFPDKPAKKTIRGFFVLSYFRCTFVVNPNLFVI